MVFAKLKTGSRDQETDDWERSIEEVKVFTGLWCDIRRGGGGGGGGAREEEETTKKKKKEKKKTSKVGLWFCGQTGVR
jgi:hypothetical protein